jgi:UDP-N-acetylmuramate--alanine ligase
VGVGGISMSALVHFSLSLGAFVEGSDMSNNAQISKLKKSGLNIYIGHSEDNLKEDVDILIYSGAIHEDNPELIKNYIRNGEIKFSLLQGSLRVGQNYKIQIAYIDKSDTIGFYSSVAVGKYTI